MKNTTFAVNGITYSTNEAGNRFYSIDATGKKVRVSEAAYTAAETKDLEAKQGVLNQKIDAVFADAQAKYKARQAADQQADDEFEQSKLNDELEEAAGTATEAQEAAKGTDTAAKLQDARKAYRTTQRKAKRAAYIMRKGDTEQIIVTLTGKQVDFIKHLPDTNFWEHGLDSTPWIDVLADEIGGQFASKPMTVGAMISTLREKGLLITGTSDITELGSKRSRRATYLALTDLGKAVAKDLGL